MSNLLIVLTGESFRSGRQMTRDRGGNNCKQTQRIASESHINFIKSIKNKYNINSDVIINGYCLNDEYDKILLSFYEEYSILINLHKNILQSEKALVDDTISRLQNIDTIKYEHILFLRLDVYIKPYFLDIFTPTKIYTNKIIYAHVDSNQYLHSLNFPMICHQICLVPKKYFINLWKDNVWNLHESAHYIAPIIGKQNIDVFIYTCHYSSTDLDWNPIYTQVGRIENMNYVSKGKYFDINNMQIYSVEL